ncbi:hypothetical protein SNE40_004719 [Patella caerulea]|uniref:Uncharacterized protein n=1 Tax=Patella caerulea TaxID=87958 RepID=A0AAN8K9E5_PATCE
MGFRDGACDDDDFGPYNDFNDGRDDPCGVDVSSNFNYHHREAFSDAGHFTCTHYVVDSGFSYWFVDDVYFAVSYDYKREFRRCNYHHKPGFSRGVTKMKNCNSATI